MRSSQRSLAAFLAMSIVSNGSAPGLLSANDVSARRFTSKRFLLCFVWLVTLLFTGRLAAQVVAEYTPTNTPNKKTGVDPSSFGSPSESVNLSTGNVHIKQPLLSLPGVNGLDLNLSVHWDSKRYDIETYSNPFIGKESVLSTPATNIYFPTTYIAPRLTLRLGLRIYELYSSPQKTLKAQPDGVSYKC